MMMKFTTTCLALTLVLALSACAKTEEKPRKGIYTPSIELTTLDFPGITPELATQAREQMRTQFAQAAGGGRCMGGTDKSDWKELSKGVSQGFGATCTTVKDASTDSTVDTEMSCNSPQMGAVTITVKGAAETESIGMDININIEKLPTGGAGKMGMKLTATRSGDC